MEMVIMKPVIRQLLILWFLGLAFSLHGSTGFDIAPYPSAFGLDSSMEGHPGPVSAPSLAFEPNVDVRKTGVSPALSPSLSIVRNGAGVPVAAPSSEKADSVPPVNNSPLEDPLISPTSAPLPSIVGKTGTPLSAPPITIPGTRPPVSHSPIEEPDIPSALAPPPNIVQRSDGVPAAAPLAEEPEPVPPMNDSSSRGHLISPSLGPLPSINRKKDGMPFVSPPNATPKPIPALIHSPAIEPDVPLIPPSPPSVTWKRNVTPVATPPSKSLKPLGPVNHSPEPDISPSLNPPPSITWKRSAMPVAAPPSRRLEPPQPVNNSPVIEPDISHSMAPPPSIPRKRAEVPVSAPPSKSPDTRRPVNSPPIKEPDISPASTPPRSITRKRDGMPGAAPPSGRLEPQEPVNQSPAPGSAISPASTPPLNATWRKGLTPNAAPASKGLEPVHRMAHSPIEDPDISPASTPTPRIGQKGEGMPNAAAPNEYPKPVIPTNHSSTKAPSSNESWKQHTSAPASSPSPKRSSNERHYLPAPPPSTPFYKRHQTRNRINSPAPTLSHPVLPPSTQPDPALSPAVLPRSQRRHYAPPSLKPGFSAPPHFSPTSDVSSAPSPSPKVSSGNSAMPFHPPKADPSGSLSRTPKSQPLPAVHALPPPPPNDDCASTICTEPYTNSPPGSPCACVLPMQVGLRLGIDLYTFFPLVSELAAEISTGVFMKQSQVRIMGANTASQQLDKTIVLIDLVPLGEKFDSTTAFLTFERFWHKKVAIKASSFGDYEVLYVRYPGLPPSPPTAPLDTTIIDGGPYSGNGNDGSTIKPLGVDVQTRQHKNGLGGGVIAVIVLSATVAVILLSAAAWVFILKQRDHVSRPSRSPRALPSSLTKSSGALGSMTGSGPCSESLSLGSSIPTYTGSAKTFTTSEIEKATDNFNPSRVLGEGGFGRVYSGILEDGTKVAVKVLKRDDQQGGREFLAEIEMLSRLHHRNLVKLIGICIEERNRCLVYELIPNGSVESHLHGVDKETSPLDWTVRIKIALGAARGLAYLHEDSSPRVIHRDFKSSNILLEDDFTPKVSDFGLARTAMDEENRHISTRVMGTFGYVAPEYAMTGHLLVKSDVYSYGVVLLELLTGRKPVDMSQPPGQENLVGWARPLLTSKDGLEAIIDLSLGPDIPFDSVSKVAAIASMCVQPEVSNRPFMGEVVQALKLVCNECEEANEAGSRTSECEDLSVDMEEASMSIDSEQLPKHLHSEFSRSTFEPGFDPERGLSVSDILSTSARLGGQQPRSFRRNSSSGPLTTGRSSQFWHRVRRLYGGSVSEHGSILRFWSGSH